ncbi:MAG: lipoprotein, partial [Oscillospiraceae bacterium]|nr:lipoprotein [Oscillospiraceae bacterium]
MRRLIILLCTVLVLTGCSGMPSRNNITNLLSAPKFSQTESNIVEAIADHIGEN